jgi:hypothetical protein
MSFLTGGPRMLVAQHRSGHGERVRHEVSAVPPAGFAGREIRISQRCPLGQRSPEVAIVHEVVTTATMVLM